MDILKDLQPLTGHGQFVFPSLQAGERPMSENTLRTALRRMGFDNDAMTPHGFRAMARTLMVERLNILPDVIDQAALARRQPVAKPLGDAIAGAPPCPDESRRCSLPTGATEARSVTLQPVLRYIAYAYAKILS
ncbi:tyrosine-type recombinase/integrase [Roseateles toxinivorans]|uniref:tyrosine-type recombinase/integrase n=1 Tax=Roseateles toxinivorans TaxID=270368 RepID=UPI001FB5A92F|nr:hypothetical protein [Roseateles toxinivorans]